MNHLRLVSSTLLLTLVGFAGPAAACSFSWAAGESPYEIKARDDVRLVRGTFRVVEARGEAGEDGLLARGLIQGEIVDAAGRRWPTTQVFDQFAAECGANLAPTADATGRFWVSERRTDNRYRLMLWDGRYSPRGNRQPERAE